MKMWKSTQLFFVLSSSKMSERVSSFNNWNIWLPLQEFDCALDCEYQMSEY